MNESIKVVSEVNKTVALSIVIPTLGRKQEVDMLLQSIEQSNIIFPYEIIVVDQNPEGFLNEICDKYAKKLPLTQYIVSFKGSSKARNFGVKKAKGEIICFPDDDAEFLPDTITTAFEIMKKKKVPCVFGKVISKKTGEDVVIKFCKEEKFLSLKDFEGAFVEATMFAKTQLIRDFQFDEELGIGTIHGAEEGYDLVFRLLKAEVSIFFSPEIKFYHPIKVMTRKSDAEVKRAFYYSCGLGYLCKKHGFVRKYRRRMLRIMLVIPVIALFRHKELKYFRAQKMGLELGYKFI